MSESDRIPTNMRALLILEIIGQSDQALTTSQIVEELGLPRQTVHRLLVTLESQGFLLRDARGSHYRPSRRLRQLGAGLLHASRHHIARHQLLKAVSDIVEETVNFVVPQESGMHYLDRVEADWVFQVQLPRGSNVPFHCTASGKTFMASLKRADRVKFVSALELTHHTDNTITDPQTLLVELEHVRKRGYAADQEEFVEQMVAYAVPVTDGQGRYIGALATHGPVTRMASKDVSTYVEALKAGSRRISEIL